MSFFARGIMRENGSDAGNFCLSASALNLLSSPGPKPFLKDHGT